MPQSPGPKPQHPNEAMKKGIPAAPTVAEKPIDFPVVLDIPPHPAWLKAREGKELWKKMCRLMMPQRVLTDADLESLAHLCQLHGEMTDNYRRKIKVPASDFQQFRMMASEFGMTPLSRTRIPSGNSKPEKNPFTQTKSNRGGGRDKIGGAAK